MNAFTTGAGYSIRRYFHERRVYREVRRANREVSRAFGAPRRVPVEKVALFSGAFVAVAAAAFALTAAAPGATTSAPVLPPIAVPAPAPAGNAAPAGEFFIKPDLSNLPPPAMTVAPPSTPSVYTIAVDKTRHEVYVLEETKDHYRIVKSYPADFGRERGDKLVQGDLKTPEGMYYITTIKREQDLAAQYGPRAYVLNYPNDVDRAQGKTGYGIWIHGSGIGPATRPSEGCVVVGDLDVAALERYAEPGTAVYIFPENFTIPVEEGVIQKHVVTPATLYSLKENLHRLAAAPATTAQR